MGRSQVLPVGDAQRPGLQQHTGRVGNEGKFCMNMWHVWDQQCSGLTWCIPERCLLNTWWSQEESLISEGGAS